MNHRAVRAYCAHINMIECQHGNKQATPPPKKNTHVPILMALGINKTIQSTQCSASDGVLLRKALQRSESEGQAAG